MIRVIEERDTKRGQILILNLLKTMNTSCTVTDGHCLVACIQQYFSLTMTKMKMAFDENKGIFVTMVTTEIQEFLLKQ